MLKKYLLLGIGLISYFLSSSQLYKHPQYPQNYFRWPTNLKQDIVANMGELRPNHWHMGLDIRTDGKVNQNVYAAADGYIAYVGIEPLSWGRWIIINHPNGLSTLYGHLNDFRDDLENYVRQHQDQTELWETHLNIPPGKFPVKKGDYISLSGTTGGSQGPHVHWEVFDTRSGRRLNPTLFGTPIVDGISPTILRIAMYDRNNSVFDQSPTIYKLSKTNGTYSVPGNIIQTNVNKLSFSIQAYDTRNGSSNQDGIYSARLFFDDRELSSFYIDSIDYEDTRYMNCQVDYKMIRNGGAWMQHTSKLPGDHGGVYYDLGPYAVINLLDTLLHSVRIEVADADGNTSNINFNIKNNAAGAPVTRSYDWLPNRPNKVLTPFFEAYLPANALYDKMNSNYTSLPTASLNGVSAKHVIGQTYIPAHSNFEVRIKPNKPISYENRNRIIIKRTSHNTTIRKAVWNGDWLTAQFRDFGTFEALIDNIPPSINALGTGEVINLNKATRIVFTPTDNYGIESLRAELDGKWLRFTNDKGRNWIYIFDDKVTPGQHTLTVRVTDVAGNSIVRSWQFIKGVNPQPTVSTVNSLAPIEEEKPIIKKEVIKSTTTKALTKKPGLNAQAATTKNKLTDKKQVDKKMVIKASSAKTTATKSSSKKETATSKTAPSKTTPLKPTTSNKKTTATNKKAISAKGDKNKSSTSPKKKAVSKK